MTRYADWKAPKQDNATLVWPDAARLTGGVTANQTALDRSSIKIQNVPLSEWRQITRRQLFGDADRPVVATGHQIELYHPGVWIKNVVVDAVSRATGAVPLHIAVDTDSPKHLQLRWPGGAIDVSDDLLLRTGEWSGQVAQPSPAHWQRVRDRFDRAAAEWNFTPSIGPVFDAVATPANSDAMLPEVLLAACRALDGKLGLDYDVRRLSTLVELPAYLALVHHIAADIERFGAAYNTALADYRHEEGIVSTTRPIPDLRTGELTELPFWLDQLDTGDRTRATVTHDGGRWHLLTETAAFAFDPSLPGDTAADRLGRFCHEQRIRLSPRALTLTTFMRLVLTDQFVHGIGGGRYDQVTDRIIQSYFHAEAPAFAVATATQYFPEAGDRDPGCVPCLIHKGHRLRHNVVVKDAFLAAINAAPRKSAARRTAYAAMHGQLRSVPPTDPALSTWREQLDRAVQRRDAETVLFDRELFYAIQPRERLLGLIDQVRRQLTAAPVAT